MNAKAKKVLTALWTYCLLIIVAFIFVFPCLWLVMGSFSATGNLYNIDGFFDTRLSVDAFVKLFTDTAIYDYPNWLLNTFIVATICCVINTLFVLMVAYSMSRFRFKGRSILMKLNLILGMFPGFLSMIIMYLVMKEIFHLDGTFWALIFIYSAGSGMGFFISKGFFDTISRSIDEAAMIDGASRARIFWDIIVPLSKPIVVYTILTAFMGPWSDYITSSYIIGANHDSWTVAIGLYNWGNSTTAATTYLRFYTAYAAGSILISIPLAALFIATQRYYVAGVTGGAVKG